MRIELTAVHYDGKPGYYNFGAEFESLEAAQKVAAIFPKMCAIKTGKYYGNVECYYIESGGKLSADGVRGDVNETAIRRLTKIITTATEAGIEIEYCAIYQNSYATIGEFLAAIGVDA